MRISKSRYESAKRRLAKMEPLQQTVRTWEEAMQSIGDVDSQRVVAIEVDDEGTIRWEGKTKLMRIMKEGG